MGSAAYAEPTLEIKPVGKIDNVKGGLFFWELKNLGDKKADLIKPIMEVRYKGNVVPDTGYGYSFDAPAGGSQKGDVWITNSVVPPGKHTVKLKIKLNDGTIVEKQQEVDFRMEPPLP